MPSHWYVTFIPSSWEDRAKPGFLILLFRGHGKWFGAVVKCWRISVVTIHPQWRSRGFFFIIQTIRHFQLKLTAQFLKKRKKQELRVELKKKPSKSRNSSNLVTKAWLSLFFSSFVMTILRGFFLEGRELPIQTPILSKEYSEGIISNHLICIWKHKKHLTFSAMKLFCYIIYRII